MGAKTAIPKQYQAPLGRIEKEKGRRIPGPYLTDFSFTIFMIQKNPRASMTVRTDSA
jgi:hypothetical protein